MKGSPCCAGLMRSCLHTYRTKTSLTQHIIQPWGGIRQVWGGPSVKYGGSSAKYGGAISQVWGGHQPTIGGGHQPSMGGYLFSHQYVQEVKIHRITLATHTSCLLRTAGPNRDIDSWFYTLGATLYFGNFPGKPHREKNCR